MEEAMLKVEEAILKVEVEIPKIGVDIPKIGVENLLFRNVILCQDKLGMLAFNTGFLTFPPDNTMIIEPCQSLRNPRI